MTLNLERETHTHTHRIREIGKHFFLEQAPSLPFVRPKKISSVKLPMFHVKRRMKSYVAKDE